jgi:D-serine deaminase-like pyridoxal phosphate-dependent protein
VNGGHDGYFLRLQDALRDAGFMRPTLVVDRRRLDANIDAVKRTLDRANLPLRIVVKSLPAHGLIDRIADGVGTDRFMVFSGAMLIEMARARPGADYLLGKPLPVAAAAQACAAIGEVSPQWLIDTRQRLAQYAALAGARHRPMRINLEIDVGLHRGGFATPGEVAGAVDAARQAGLQVCGLLGYDPHTPKTPDPPRAHTAAQKAYEGAKAVLMEKYGDEAARMIFNGAGSPTYALHAEGSQANEVAVGSAFVKPTDFDLPTLAHHQPAAFIATPVLKALARTDIPSLEAATGIFRLFDPNTAQAFFIHGGHWLAKPESPAGLQYNALFGRSSNQELLTGGRGVTLGVDDLAFFRPTQSEAVFLQFGDIAVFDGERISATWPTFPVSA